ncbi:hypothetical protein Dda_3873 [Drechslerella dactyloides]|uniref:Uncharacterized protein n=1 Tax=Drechslerella dactyloides TaxID=74499 RepID=A0AAD6NKA9_DREDA|nr:hypothetical protein Dda_3873 [Drechslerella dactyloides]
MASPPLNLGFAHTPDRLLPSSLGLPTASYFIRDCHLLAIGYASGAIALIESVGDGTRQRLRNYLSGHEAAVVAFESIAVRSPSGNDDVILLSLSLDGSVRKWDAADGRCLQAAEAVFEARPRGIAVVPIPAVNSEGKPLEFNWLTDYYVLVYGCTTAIIALSFTTLSAISLWTGHQDWPVVLSIPGASHNTVFTVEKEGSLQPWTLVKRPPGVIDITRVQDTPLSIGDKRLGAVVSAILFHDSKEEDEDKVLVVQNNGLCVYQCIKSGGIRLQFLQSVDEVALVRGAAVQGQSIFCFLQGGNMSIYNADDLEVLERVSQLRSPDYRTIFYAAGESPTGKTQVTAFTVTNGGANSIITGYKGSKEEALRWSDPDLQGLEKNSDEREIVSSTASALFECTIAFAIGNVLNLYTLDHFLLNLSSPSHSIQLPNHSDRVNILQPIQLPKTAASDEQDYLVVGLDNGCIYLVEPESFQISGCLSLHPGPIAGVIVLPADLAPRIRSTLLVYSENGSASIVDIIPAVSESSPFKVRTLLTLPSSMAPRKLVCVATQKGRNILLLIDSDGRKRLWDVDSIEGGPIVNDTESPQSTNSHDNQNPEELGSSKEPWREHRLADSKNDPPVGQPTSIVRDSKSPSMHGYPTAKVDIFAIIRYLHKRTKSADEVKALSMHANVLLPARSLLTVLVDYLGILDEPLPYEGKLELKQMLVECQSSVSIVQVDCEGDISILLRDKSQSPSSRWKDMSSRGRTQMVTSICSLVYTILHLTTGSEAMSKGDGLLRETALSVLKHRRESEGSGLDLALLCEFWTDLNPWIRGSCRILLQIELSLLKQREIRHAIDYWQDYLPTQISHELFTLKDVHRAVVVLAIMIILLDDENTSEFKIDRGLRRNVALSIELFLTDSDTAYQDVAVDLVSEGWLSWQSEFDAFEVIHILMRILATPSLPEDRIQKINRAFIKIAQKNAPLLASGLANCISHTAPEKGIALTTLTDLVNLSIAAKRTVISIVRADPYLFAEPEIIKVVVDAIVKILDPQGGQIRERVLQYVSELVNEIVDAYPTVAFHRPTQRLAVSASPRSIMIYDLNTAKPVASLEGHTRTVQFLTFSGDGKTIVGIDLDESQVLVWKIAVSIFSSFIGAAANMGVIGTEGIGVITAKAKYGFKNSKSVGMVRIEFTGERTVRITAGADVTLVNI